MRRLFVAGFFLLTTAWNASAQVQERKLIDRLLEPNMSLENGAQGKQFRLAPGNTQNRTARTRPFYVRERAPEKEFHPRRNFFTRIFGTRRARENTARASLVTRHETRTPQLTAPPSRYATRRPAARPTDSYAVSEFSGTRPFLVQGKSQKALSRQPRPLTIDEVRELLNKNK